MREVVNGIRGWYFDREVVERANRDARLLTMDFEYGHACRLRCIYCYRTEDHRDDGKGLLTFDQWKGVVDDAVSLGLASVKLIGGGEITEERGFMEAMEYVAAKGVTIVLFTAGTTLGDDVLCRKCHGMDGRSLAKWMYDLGMSVFLKVDSLNRELQDRLVGTPGYAAVRDQAFDVLLAQGFDDGNPTRLGLEVNVSRHNVHEIMDIYSLRAKYNLYEDVVISMPCDSYYRNPDYDITLEQKRELYRRIYQFNADYGIPFDELSPFIGGLECSQLGNGVYVTNRGDVYHCPGSFDSPGNVKTVSLGELWEGFAAARQYHQHYFCPFREEAGIIPTETVRELTSEICPRDRSH